MLKITPTEHGETAALIERTRLATGRYPQLRLLFAIKNEAAYKNARLRAEGIRNGVFDLMLPVARGAYHGLFLEMKVGKNQLSPEQTVFAFEMRQEGYCTIVCWGQDAAFRALITYLGGERKWIKKKHHIFLLS